MSRKRNIPQEAIDQLCEENDQPEEVGIDIMEREVTVTLTIAEVASLAASGIMSQRHGIEDVSLDSAVQKLRAVIKEDAARYRDFPTFVEEA